MRRVVQRIQAAVRDGWLVTGITILLFLALDGAYRLQASVRREFRGHHAEIKAFDDPTHPNATEQWWHEVTGTTPSSRTVRFDPFRGWWPRPQRSRHINVDSLGRRVTVQPSSVREQRRRIAMFGGSVMWGWIVRDSFTVPSLVATRLRNAGYDDVEVVNFAQSMFDLTQNAATLSQEIRHGRVPAVAVFLDGNNEVAPVFQSGEQGHVLNEMILAQRFERAAGVGAELMTLLKRSALVQRIAVRPPPPPSDNRLHFCPAIAGSYERQVRAVTAIATEFQFSGIFLWQPLRATTAKRLTAWERRISSNAGWRDMVRRCSAAVDSALALRPDIAFHNLRSLFDGDANTVFLDDYGHLTERANALLADDIATRVAERLGPPDRRRVP